MLARANKIVGAALLLPMMLFAVLGTSFAAWQCRFDGMVRAGCCCPGDDTASVEDTAAHMDDGGCCDLQRRDLEKSPAEMASGKNDLPAPIVVWLAVVYPIGNTHPPVVVASPTTRAGPPQGRLIVVRKHAFLI